MDLELTAEHQQLDQAVATLMNRQAGPDRARELSDKMDRALLDALSNSGFLDTVSEAGPIEGVLVVERAAEALACAPVAARVLVGPLAGIHNLPPAVGLADGRVDAMVRHGAECEAFLVLDGGGDAGAVLADADDVDVRPVAASFGPGYALVTVRSGEELGPEVGARLRRAWQVAIAVEAASTMRAAVLKTVEHVTQRHQFGRPIGSFQAVQHKLAQAYVGAEASKWLARRAAWFHDDEFVTASAAAYACESAELAYANTHQVTGAIGVTTEYGLVLWTLRLLALRSALGGKRMHARRVAAARRRMDLSELPSPVHP
jgi:alkylation response protein AidB-like acyl-CoA dehydrogenase